MINTPSRMLLSGIARLAFLRPQLSRRRQVPADHYVGMDAAERAYGKHLLARSFRQDGDVSNETVAQPVDSPARRSGLC